MKFRILPVIFLLSILNVHAQDVAIDSLKKNLSRAKEDTNKVLLLNDICIEFIRSGKSDEAMKYAVQGKELGEQIKFQAGISTSLNKMGLIYYNRGELSKALEACLASLKICEEGNDLPGESRAHNNIGNIFVRQKEYAKALEHYEKCLVIKQKLGDKKNIANSLNNIGTVYNSKGDQMKALDYFLKALNIDEQIHDSVGMADVHNNIGTVFEDNGDPANALSNYQVAFAIRRKTGDKEGIASSCINMASVTFRTALLEKDPAMKAKKFEEARKHLAEAISISTEIKAPDDLKDAYGLLASLDSAQGNWKDAFQYHQKFILCRDSLDNEENTRKMVEAEMNFSFSKTQAVQQAEQDKKDAIATAEIRKQRMILWFAVIGLLFMLIFALIVFRSYRQKQASARIIEQKNVELERLSLAASETHNVVIILSPDGKVEWANESFTRLNGITIEELKRRKGETIFEISNNPAIRQAFNEAVSKKRSVVYESLNLNRAGDKIWESSTLTPIFAADGTLKKLVIIDADITKRKETEEKLSLRNKDITDSITYAQRIQGAILIPETELRKEFSDVFVLFKPKDIVSGDFYWFAESKYNKILAVADCTGHGVPGGFMSMLGFAMLQETLLQEDVKTTATAFAELDKKITDTLNRNDRTHRDGMDMVLCAFSKSESKLQFSCANRPLIRIRNKELKEFRADKYPIGGAIDDTAKQFHSMDVDIQKGDTFYLFTDGYADQFGGERQKKFMYKKFLETLLVISDESLYAQKKILDKTFDNWKGKLDQVDDVLVIGIRI